jgi:hypothetical protein
VTWVAFNRREAFKLIEDSHEHSAPCLLALHGRGDVGPKNLTNRRRCGGAPRRILTAKSRLPCWHPQKGRRPLTSCLPNIANTMADSEELDRLRGLFQDLTAYTEGRLQNYGRLFDNLNATVEDFRRLLDKPPKSDASRKAVQSGASILSLTAISSS